MIAVRPARREDVPAIVAMLADDHLGRDRETPDQLDPYYAAFERIAADGRNLLVVAEADGAVVGTLQLTFIPGLGSQGAELCLIEAVRIASTLRGRGLGRQLIAWALDQARGRGCRFAELLSHASRLDAHRFYEGLGFAKSHVGMKIAL